MLHPVSDPGVVWYGGMGHRILSNDAGIECYRCGMAADDSAWQELIQDCVPDARDHHWVGTYVGAFPKNECAYGDAFETPNGGVEQAGGRCRRA